MPGSDISAQLELFRQTLEECRDLFVSSGTLCAREYPRLIAGPKEKFIELMDDLHRALLVKVYFAICEADRRWSEAERQLAEILFEHLWAKKLTGEALAEVACRTAEDATKLKWYAIVRPFDQIAPLREQVGLLETLVMRLANLIARADGELHPKEAAMIKSIQGELRHHLRPIPIDEPNQHETADALGNQAVETMQQEADDFHASRTNNPVQPSAATKRTKSSTPQSAPAVTLQDALAELDSLIGLDPIKQEVRTLTNFLKVQKRRAEAGLPDTEISLHMVFTGNPGTGKTSVARVVGKIMGAMGILVKGHLIETDRSGLVAEYAGQTGPRTNAKVNEALDGVLFIDEAYSLVFQDGQDPYGGEAVQALLKRSEDDRDRLVVVLAGYPEEMQKLLQSNPGLSSRFSRLLQFDDYSPVELARIFACLCEKSHYTLAPAARAKLLLGFTELHTRRNRHFGNGRTARNLFEQAIRRMANRIADIPKITHEQLTQLEDVDIEFKDLPAGWMRRHEQQPPKFRVACSNCGHVSKSPGDFLGQKVRCPKCKKDFLANWGEPAI